MGVKETYVTIWRGDEVIRKKIVARELPIEEFEKEQEKKRRQEFHKDIKKEKEKKEKEEREGTGT